MKKEKKASISKGRKIDNIEFLLLALPAIILLFIFSYWPMYGLIIAFKNFNPILGIEKSEWCGFSNFEFFFRSSDFIRVTRNTVGYGLAFLILGTAASVILALLFYNLRNRAALKVYNTIVILPKFMSMVLIAYVVYAILNPVSGVLNKMLVAFGMKNTVDWYATPGAWPLILIIVNLWSTIGMNSILYYAALMGIDMSLFEAAAIDGANKLQSTVHIAIPHLVSIISITSILAIGNLFSGDFGLFYQTTRDVGLLYPTTDIINTYVFRSLQGGEMSRGAAVGLFQSVMGLIMVVAANAAVKKISPENSLF